MNINISFNNKTQLYDAQVFDGPDGIDSVAFHCKSLCELFQKIIVFSTMNSLTYCEAGAEITNANQYYFGSLDL